MGTIHCRCGQTFSDGEIPSPHCFFLISEAGFEAAISEIEALDWTAEFAGDKADRALHDRGHASYRCPHCARMLIFEEGFGKPATSYRRE